MERMHTYAAISFLRHFFTILQIKGERRQKQISLLRVSFFAIAERKKIRIAQQYDNEHTSTETLQ